MNRSLLLLPLLFLCLSSSAQEPVFRQYTSRDGLPSSEVYCVTQDPRGYLWFGTDRGVARFDGYEFTTFSSTDGMADNTIFGFFEDAESRLWYQSYTGLTGYIRNDTPHLYPYNHVLKSLVASSMLKALLPYKEGLWATIGRDYSFLTVFIDSNGRVERLTNYDTGSMELYIPPSGAVLNSGNPYAHRIRVFSLETRKQLLSLPYSSRGTYPLFTRGRHGDTWLYFDDDVWHIQGEHCEMVLKDQHGINYMYTDRDNNLWLGFVHKGLFFAPAAGGYSTLVRMKRDGSVSGIYQDREGGTWITTLENGVLYLPPDHYFSYGYGTGFPQPKVMRIQDIKGRALVLLSNMQLILHMPDGSFKALNNPSQQPIHGIFCDSTGVAFCCLPGYYRQTPLPMIRSVFIEAGGSVQQMGELMISRLNTLIVLSNREGKEHSKISLDTFGRPVCTLPLHNGDLLIGTIEGLCLHRKGKTTSLGHHHPLLRSRVSDLAMPDSSHLLIGTVGQGVLLVTDNDFDHPVRFGLQDGLPSLMCHKLLCDHDSVVWVGTNRGLCRIGHFLDPPRRTVQNTDVNSGLISNEITDLHFVGDTLWVGTADGLSLLPRSARTIGPATFPLYLKAVQVNGTTIDSHIPGRFAYDRNNIGLSFIALHYQYHDGILYRYRLLGISDTSWHTTAARTAQYNTLAPGNYVFELQASVPGRMRESALLHYAFVILPPFWKTGWFLTIAILLLTAGIYTFISSRIRFVKKQAQIRNDLNRSREKALRAQMNPHFIYNAMNSVQNYIHKSDLTASNVFLSKFSQLMRLTFNNSDEELVPLAKDLQALRLYADIESMRFPRRFLLAIHVDPGIDPDRVQVPPLLIQPFVENAILHGFLMRETTGYIGVDIRPGNDRLKISIRDDGIGIHEARRIKKKKERFFSPEKRNQSGTITTIARIGQAWGKYNPEDFFRITDLSDDLDAQTGTLVVFYLPLHETTHDQSSNRR